MSTTTPSTSLRSHGSNDPRFGTELVVAVVVVLVGFVLAITVAVLPGSAGGREVEAASAGPLVRAMPPVILLGGLCVVGLVTALVRSMRGAGPPPAATTVTAVLAAPTGISVIGTDAAGTITVFNAGAERLLGVSSDEVVGTSTPVRFHEPGELATRAGELGIAPGFEVLVHAARGEVPETRRWTYVRADGRRVPVEVTVAPMTDADGGLLGFVAVATDITGRLAREVEHISALRREREVVAELRELDEAKTDFLSTVSHELRTPLTSILAYAEILGQHRAGGDHGAGADASLDDEAVRVITRNGRRLLALAEDLLRLSWAETGSLDLAMEPCEVDVLVASVLETLAPLAAEKRIRILVGPGPTPPVMGDRRQLERVLLNVLGNAVKFSPAGTDVRISTVLDARHLEIRVEDQGIGIPADELGRVFERFARARRAEHQSIGGTGLGLAIVAEVVQRHGGWVTIDSTEGIGTTVGIHLRTMVIEPAHRELQAARS